MRKKIHLFGIDLQNDFMDPNGALYVPGAVEDAQRIAHFVKLNLSKFDDIFMTLDSHHLVHISHPIFWRNSNGDQPKPGDVITSKDMEVGKWTTRIPSHWKIAYQYLQDLEKNGKYPHRIWTPHCLIGSSGHAVQPLVFEAVTAWEQEFAVVNYQTKGSNLFREHFSVFKAEVEDPADYSTKLNVDLIQAIEAADEIIVIGEALSHCLRSSLLDLIENLSDPSFIKKMTLLRDCTSPVPGFEQESENFINELIARGMKVTYSDKYVF